MNRQNKEYGFTGLNVNVSEHIIFHPKLETMNKRKCYKDLRYFLKNKNSVHICGLFGLRRTGKSIRMQQAAKELLSEGIPCAYIICDDQHSIFDLKQEIDLLNEQGIRHVFVDEVDLLEDFMNSSHLLSDGISSEVRIVLAVTASLQLKLVSQGKLYDRIYIIPTNYISLPEHDQLTDIKGPYFYVSSGGTLTEMAIMTGSVFFHGYGATYEYVSSSIVDNIIQTLVKQNRIASGEDRYNEFLTYKEAVYVVLEMQTYEFVKTILDEVSKSSTAYNFASDLILPPDTYIPDDSFVKIIQKMLEIMGVIQKDEHFLINGNRMERFSAWQEYLFLQPGLLYQMACHEMLNILDQSEFERLGFVKKRSLIEQLKEQILIRCLKDNIRYDLINHYSDGYYKESVCKLTDTSSKTEIPVAIIHENNVIDLYDITYQTDIINTAGSWAHSAITNPDFLNNLKRIFKIGKTAVIYNGETKMFEDPDSNCSIKYINVTEFLQTYNRDCLENMELN